MKSNKDHSRTDLAVEGRVWHTRCYQGLSWFRLEQIQNLCCLDCPWYRTGSTEAARVCTVHCSHCRARPRLGQPGTRCCTGSGRRGEMGDHWVSPSCVQVSPAPVQSTSHWSAGHCTEECVLPGHVVIQQYCFRLRVSRMLVSCWWAVPRTHCWAWPRCGEPPTWRLEPGTEKYYLSQLCWLSRTVECLVSC